MQNPTPFPHPEAEFRRALMDGRFLIQRCTATGRFVFYPRAISPWSGLPTLEWVPASGDGTVYSTTLVRRKPDRGGDYNVAMVALKEGPMMMSRIIGIAPDQVRIGQPVRAEIHPIDSEPQILFRPDETNQ